MPRMSSRALSGLMISLLPLTAAAQVTFVRFTFEDTTAAMVGSTLSLVSWNSGGAEGYANGFLDQGRALSVGNFQSGEYYQLTLNATGYTNITLNSFRSNGSAAAPKDWKISYSLTGVSGSYVDASTYVLASNNAVGTTTIGGLALPAGANNNSSIVLRLTATSSSRIDGTASAANGTVRLDNISFTGTAIPEPATVGAILGVAVLAFAACRNRAKQKARLVAGREGEGK